MEGAPKQTMEGGLVDGTPMQSFEGDLGEDDSQYFDNNWGEVNQDLLRIVRKFSPVSQGVETQCVSGDTQNLLGDTQCVLGDTQCCSGDTQIGGML